LSPTSHVSTLAKGKASWYALQVWVRKETAIANQLQAQGLECFLPKYKSLRQWSDRRKEVEQPLFPGYLFCRFEYLQRRPVVITPGVLQIVGNGRTALPVEDREVEALQAAVASGIGERVRIQTGKLTGLEGILINFKGNHRVVLSVSLLQRSVALEVDLGWVASVERNRRTTPEHRLAGEPVQSLG